MDQNRRNFLKLIFVGSSVLFVEKVMGSLFPRFFNDIVAKPNPPKVSDKTNFKSFHIIENSQRLSIYDSSGEEIFQIDKKT